MNEFLGNLWVQVYVNCMKEYFDPDVAQSAANEAVARLIESDKMYEEAKFSRGVAEMPEGGESKE